jgi:hypothetical protein
MLSIALVVLSFFTALILALVGRSKKTGIHTAWLALLIVVLNLILYQLAIQCPGW